jgi:DMSO/TMAO reductase YedYZ molybdopterin-dependent catalytic subunit
MRRWLVSTCAGAASGLLAGASGVAIGQLVAAITRPESAPLITVGGTIVDATPTPLKEFAIRQFGTNDKLVLMLSIGAGLTAFAALVGVLGVRHRRLGQAGAAVFGLIGIAAAITRPAHQSLDILPAVVGGVTAVAVLGFLLTRFAASTRAAENQAANQADASQPAANRADAVTGDAETPSGPGTGRRTFLQAGGLVALAAAAVTAGGYTLSGVRTAGAGKLRDAVRLPRPASPAGARSTSPGFYTATKDFYRVDTALTVPRVDPAGWRLRIHGMVDHPSTLDFDTLTARPAIERDITLNCVSNEVGGPYIGTARWLGIPLAPLLRAAGIHSEADQIVARSVDGMTIGTPLSTALDGRDTMLAVAMNGEPLPLEHGFPVRMLTPGLYGYVGACKWITDLELTRFDAYDTYWVRRRWASRAPVKTASRIDRPQPLATVSAGLVRVAGVAWAQHRGIRTVEVQVDDGPWRPARLLAPPSIDTWVQWTYDWAATKGEHQLRVRATDGTGRVQTQQRAGTFPNGASGWHTVALTVG